MMAASAGMSACTRCAAPWWMAPRGRSVRGGSLRQTCAKYSSKSRHVPRGGPNGSITMSTALPRIVLDTNACLGLWVFRDPRAAALLAALDDGAIEAVTNTDCRDEWLRVLHYPPLRLGDGPRIAHAAAHDSLVRRLPDARRPADALPRCADPDDQKFLQLALASGARWLISRDGDVLALGRRTRRDGLLEIVSPQGWAHWSMLGS